MLFCLPKKCTNSLTWHQSNFPPLFSTTVPIRTSWSAFCSPHWLSHSLPLPLSFVSYTLLPEQTLSILKGPIQVPPLLALWGFPGGSAGKESTWNVGDLGSIPGLGRSPGEGNSYPLQYSGLENSMDCIVHGVAKSWTRLSHFHFTSLWKHHHRNYFLLNFLLQPTPLELITA